MVAIIGILYFIIFIVCVIAALFIVYHIVKYSLTKSAMALMLGIFLSVFGALIFANLLLFLSLRWDRIFPI